VARRPEEEDWAQAFIGIKFGGQRVLGDFKGTKPSHYGSKGVTLTMMPQRA